LQLIFGHSIPIPDRDIGKANNTIEGIFKVMGDSMSKGVQFGIADFQFGGILA
jgi:hypothetical protein